MSKLKFLVPKDGKEIPFLILISFFSTFIVSRAFLFLVPGLFLTVRGVHIHHFAYGIVLLAISNFLLLTQPRTFQVRIRFALIYGVSLGLAFDEFVMWTQLEGNYWNRTNFDAISLVILILLNIVYFDGFWRKWGHRLGKFLHLVSTD